MANELRVRQNFLGGLVEDNPLAIGATSMTSPGFGAMVAVGSTQHLPIVLDPDGVFGEPEIVYVTAHTAGTLTATIQRAREGTVARQHNRDTPWLHGGVISDIEGAWTAYTPTWTSSPTNPTIGNGVLLGRYFKLGRTVSISITLQFGSTTTAGSGGWAFSLPVAPQTVYDQSLVARILDSGTDNKAGVANVSASAANINQVTAEGGNTIGAGDPMVWATNDAVYITGVYESAV